MGLDNPHTAPAGLLLAVSGLWQTRFEHLFRAVSRHYRSSITHRAR